MRRRQQQPVRIHLLEETSDELLRGVLTALSRFGSLLPGQYPDDTRAPQYIETMPGHLHPRQNCMASRPSRRNSRRQRCLFLGESKL